MELTAYCHQLAGCTAIKHRQQWLTKIMLVMRITAVLLLAACLQVSARGVSQTLTLSFKNAPLEQVLNEIQKQTGYSFFYEDGLLKNAKPVDIAVKKVTLAQALEICFNNQPFTYKIVNNAVSIRRKEMAIEAAMQLPPTTGDPVTVSGKVTDAQGQPLVGANVKVKGSSTGTTTDNLGRFTLANLNEDAILEISFVGHDAQSFHIKGKPFLAIALVQKQSILDETVIIGYGTSSRRFTTGNIATIKSEDIEKRPVQNPLLALQGRVPGVEVTQLSGLNGGGVQVRIQGINSIGSLGTGTIKTGSDPLVVVDGVPYPTQLVDSRMEAIVQGGSPLNYINPTDIESMDVLKDADATAIYGSRAASGAILITTKKGKVGRTAFNVNIQQGWGKVTRMADMMNTRQYLDMRYEAYRNTGVPVSTLKSDASNYDITLWDTTRNTDWQEVLIGGSAQYTNINAGISGGAPNVQYLVNGTYNRRTTVFPGNFDDKIGGLHFNINASSNDQRFRLQLTGSYMFDQNHLGDDLTNLSVKTEPNAPPLYTDNGILNWAPDVAGNSSWVNPLAASVNRDFFNTTKNLVTNAVMSYLILSGLRFSCSFGYTDLRSDLYLPSRLEAERPERRATAQRRASFGNRSMGSWIMEPQFLYTGKIGQGKIEGLLGATVQKSSTNSLSIFGSGFASDLLMKSLLFATSSMPLVSSTEINRFNALFGRLNYVWANKYLINLTGRRDGSNKFGGANKFHNFWSVGAGWIFSEEKWIQQNLPFLSFGKLRASYGTTGNDQIPSFSYLSIYNINNPSILYQNNYGLNPVGIPNPHLQWEETRKLQGGIDLGIFADRLVIGATYAINRSSNQLIGYILPDLTGFSTITKNLPATVRNTSWEFIVNGTILKSKDFCWNSSINLTIPRNKVLSFPGIEFTSYSSGTQGIIVGQPIGVAKVLNYYGINPASGRYLALDKNGNPTYTPNSPTDNIGLVSTLSDWYGGWVNSISFKGVQLDVLLQFVRKKGPRDLFFYNGSMYPGEFFSGSSNQSTSVLNRWQKPGDNGLIGRYSTSELGIRTITDSDSWYSYDASYARLKNLSLSWQLPVVWLKKMHLKNARVYFRGENLATFTHYTGLDPETMSLSALPPLKMWTIGGQIGF
jgi:TonB-linked SusC/RagA family outer membrane protein